jgi:hypothetical protein
LIFAIWINKNLVEQFDFKLSVGPVNDFCANTLFQGFFATFSVSGAAKMKKIDRLSRRQPFKMAVCHKSSFFRIIRGKNEVVWKA